MRVYHAVTGGQGAFGSVGGADLRGFWKMSPAELFAWGEALAGERGDLFEGMGVGDEVED